MASTAVIVDAFNKLALDGAYVLEFSVDPGIKLSLTLLQDPAKISVGDACNRWDLQFNRIRAASVKLAKSGEHLQVMSHHATVADRELVRFSLAFASGTIEVTGVDFTLAVVEEIPMKTGTLGP